MKVGGSHDLIHCLTKSGHILPGEVIEGGGKARGDCDAQLCKGGMCNVLEKLLEPAQEFSTAQRG